jgi:hypothetical protein
MSGTAEIQVAALYVEKGGVYWDLPGVDPWDEERDARLYAGPWPVVAHPPCEAWSLFGPVRAAKWGLPVGEDGGCFEAALAAVRSYGGVLEHPRFSRAWDRFGLPRPCSRGWAETLEGEWVAEVDQAAYGHRLHKPTWLLYVGGSAPLALDNSEPPARTFHSVTSAWRKPTPPAFRDVLLDMARSAAFVRDGVA